MIQDVATGLGDRLRTIEGLRVTDYIPDAPNSPAAWPMLSSLDPHRAMARGLEQATFDVVIAIAAGRGMDRTRHEQMNGYLSTSGATSVLLAVEGDRTLAGVVSDLVVRPYGIEGYQDIAGSSFLIARWPVYVIL